MHIYAVGPIMMDDETLAISNQQLPYFRTEAFSDTMLYCDRVLKQLLKTSQESASMYLTASGTAAMEAAVINIFTKEDKVLVINGGTFGKRFYQLCMEVHDIPNVSIDIPYGKALIREDLYRYENEGFTGLLVNIHETLTGQLYDIAMISEFCQQQNICLVVDAISTFLVDDFNMDKYCIDAVIISSQKGLGLAPGLSMLFVNKQTYEQRVKNNQPTSLFLRFKEYYPEIKRGQTPYTPPMGVIVQLQEKLKRIEKMSIGAIIDHNREVAQHFRSLLDKTPLQYPDYQLSNGVTPVYCPNHNASHIVKELIRKWDIYVIPSAGKLSEKAFRVGHMGLKIQKEDMDFLVEHIVDILKN